VTPVNTTTPRPDPAADATVVPVARTRNRRGEGGRLRPQILAAAAELLDEGGTEEAVTLRAVARRAGIATPSIYAHFADRQAILLAIVRDAFTELARQLAEASGDPDPVVRLHAVCAAYLQYATTRPQHYRVMFGGLWNAARAVDADEITEDEAATLGQDVLGVLVAALQQCVAGGRSSSDDPYADAVALWLGLHGLAHQRTAASAFVWPDDVVDRIVAPLAHLQK
jgi:AcrR family transcriptional regulator